MIVIANTRVPLAKFRSRHKKAWSPQLQKYHLTWQNIFAKHNWADKSEKEKRELRHSILQDLFGTVINVSSATELQWDCIFLAQKILLNEGLLIWSSEMAKYAVETCSCKRYIWNIEHAGYDIDLIEEYGAPEEYIASISEDRFKTRNWRVLNSNQLWQLFITIKNRVRSSGGTLHDRNYIENNDDPF